MMLWAFWFLSGEIQVEWDGMFRGQAKLRVWWASRSLEKSQCCYCCAVIPAADPTSECQVITISLMDVDRCCRVESVTPVHGNLNWILIVFIGNVPPPLFLEKNYCLVIEDKKFQIERLNASGRISFNLVSGYQPPR
ncbi:hypothetical protein P154DRAFT_142597 [Amniculicola lignicola CBS 123094]|uniref:Uncharacterized protein n=1 Tax=Amniculicola lignicola CBS 123094 TaxID=1392246 RepID=A0A6A5WT26_9PLEO|nr:hypothetical protein P154DRAFT_142597 [Amniculicola lignicola CBS 123094]